MNNVLTYHFMMVDFFSKKRKIYKEEYFDQYLLKNSSNVAITINTSIRDFYFDKMVSEILDPFLLPDLIKLCCAG